MLEALRTGIYRAAGNAASDSRPFKALRPFCHGLTFDLVLGDVVRFDSLNVKTLNP